MRSDFALLMPELGPRPVLLCVKFDKCVFGQWSPTCSFVQLSHLHLHLSTSVSLFELRLFYLSPAAHHTGDTLA